MAITAQRMLDLGTPLPAFELRDFSGRVVRTEHYRGKPLLVAFICNHCPYVKHVKAELARLGRDLEALGVGMVAINPNDASRYPDDAPVKMAEDARTHGYTFPYLVDEEQTVASAFHAACTPEFYLFDRDAKLVYRGQLDDSRPNGTKPVTGRDVRNAVDALVHGRAISSVQTPSMGCSIKWKPGHAPA